MASGLAMQATWAM